MHTIIINDEEWVELSLAVEAALEDKYKDAERKKILKELLQKIDDAPTEGMRRA